MSTFNPYAPPSADLDTHPEDCPCWRNGRDTILTRGHALPERCVKCNAPTATPVRVHQLRWRHPIYGLFNRHAKVGVPLCPYHERHFRMYRRISLAATAGALLGLCGMICSPLYEISSLPAALMTVLCATVAIFIQAFVAPLKAMRISKKCIHLRGCCDAFLDALPDYPDR